MAKLNLTHCIMRQGLKHSYVSEKERKKIGSLKRMVKMSGKFILIDISSAYHFDSRMTWNKKRTCQVHFKTVCEKTPTREIKFYWLPLIISTVSFGTFKY